MNIKQMSFKLEALKEDATPLKIKVIEIIQKDINEYDNPVSFFEDLLNNGCVNGGISELIYNIDTHSFFDKYYTDIMELVNEWEDNTDSRIEHDRDVKNSYAWFAFEELTRIIANELDLNI